MVETQTLLQNMNLSGLQGSDWPAYSRYNPEKNSHVSKNGLVSQVSSNGKTSPISLNGQNGSVASSSSGYETGSNSSGVSEKEMSTTRDVRDFRSTDRRQSLATNTRGNPLHLSVNGDTFSNARRRSASVNRYENLPDSPPPYRERSMRPSSSMMNLDRGSRNKNDDWSVSSTRRQFKFTQEGFDMARSAPIVHKPTLKIGIEGQREFKLSNNEDFPAYNVREISSARPGGRYRPSSVTTGKATEGPLVARTESREHYSDSGRGQGGTSSPASTLSDVTLTSSGVRSPTAQPSSSSRSSARSFTRTSQDPRFSAGSTTRSTYRDVSAYNDEARPRSVKPLVSLRMEGDFSRSVSSKEHFQPLPYSRTPATVRKPMIEVPAGKFETSTSYRRDHVDDKALYNGLRRSSRFDYSLRIPDKIDWL